jgi:hypothetical protein
VKERQQLRVRMHTFALTLIPLYAYLPSMSFFLRGSSEGFFSKQFGQQICACIQMISFRLHKRHRSTQVTFDTNQLEEKEKEKDYDHLIDPK